ncbi:methylmalonyl-CoA mutase metallochaperone MeaB [Balneicella halophila]|uniref:Methylmalonyl-CoA mutase metallochaperone MeaB n=1 Tax=Balneicella halophila TaxID=1537566 RepID=A0A7L4UMI7_BALHA|nr:methylmalonyl Co-A mutase-associated GTPase MeaB [Balneicella halophila]PVX49834.1 methylmalonyl-CoA mutase metallochaperone MeaB [Balneicella halophila]
MAHIEDKEDYKSLGVMKGVETPPVVNPKALERVRKIKRVKLNLESLVQGILAGRSDVLARAITLLESTKKEHRALAQEVLEKCLPHTGKALRIGITGVPGAGKSTFIEAFGKMLTKQGYRIAVLAIDPSSQKSKGSILGDKTRMEELAGDSKAFIRPSPSGTSLGGVARKTREAALFCEAAGYDIVLIETVGVGQSETAVHSMVDFFLLLQIAGAGDELQGIKRGIMEMAELIVINKADGNNKQKAALAKVQIDNALHLFPPPDSGWYPTSMTCSSIDKNGIPEIWEKIQDYFEFTRANGYLNARRREQAIYWMHESINEYLKDDFFNDEVVKKNLPIKKQQVLNNQLSSFIAANQLFKEYKRR